MRSPADHRPLLRLLFAVLLLNAILTFCNLWPTPWVLPTAELSLEAALLLAALALHGIWRGRLGRGGRWLVAVVVLMLVLLRYADVTAHALFGRAIDLYWDLPYLRSEEHTSELQSLMRIPYDGFCLTKTITNLH